MRLKRIYASKLYVTSTRKDRIHAAMQDPINVELVQQLSEYLDDEAQDELKRAKMSIKKKSAGNDVQDDEGDARGSDGGSAPRSGGGAPISRSSFTGSPSADFGDDPLADIDIPDDGGEAPDMDTDMPEEPIESVTQEGKKITATSLIWTTIEDVSRDCDTIQGTLNAREDTCGVTRMQVTDSELWIYYNDDSNLNDKMVEVISVLNSTGYTYLKFNRLARSNNAIVFDINLNSSDMIKSAKDLEDEDK